MRVLASLRRLPRYPLEAFFWTAPPDLGRRRSSPTSSSRRSTHSRCTPAARRMSSPHDVGWAIDVWGALGQRLVPRDRAARLRRPGALDRVLPAVPAARPRASAGSCSGTTCWPASSCRWPPPPSRSSCSGSSRSQLTGRARRPTGRVLYLAVFPTTLFLIAVYSESLYLLLSVAAFLLAVRRPLGVGRGRGRPRGVDARLRRDPPAGARGARVALRRTARGRSLRLAISLPVMALWPLYLGLRPRRPFVFLVGPARRVGSPPLRCRPARRRLGRPRRRLARCPSARRRLGPRLLSEHRPQRDVRGGPEPRAARIRACCSSGLGVYAWRALGAAYGIFVLGSLALPLSDPVPSSPLLSMPRFALGVFPVFVVLGMLGCAAAGEHGARDGLRGAARDQPRPLGALDLGGLSPTAHSSTASASRSAAKLASVTSPRSSPSAWSGSRDSRNGRGTRRGRARVSTPGSPSSVPRKPRKARPWHQSRRDLARSDEVEAGREVGPAGDRSRAPRPCRCTAGRWRRRRTPRARSRRSRAAAASGGAARTRSRSPSPRRSGCPPGVRRGPGRGCRSAGPPRHRTRFRPRSRSASRSPCPSEIEVVLPAWSASSACTAATTGSRGSPSARGNTLAPPPGRNPNGTSPEAPLIASLYVPSPEKTTTASAS